MNLRVNQDGKLWDRFVASAIPVAIGLVVAGIVWWKDVSNAESRANEDILRIEARIDKVETEAREARRREAEDRQRIAEMAADLRSTSKEVSRIGGLLDRWIGPPPVRP